MGCKSSKVNPEAVNPQKQGNMEKKDHNQLTTEANLETQENMDTDRVAQIGISKTADEIKLAKFRELSKQTSQGNLDPKLIISSHQQEEFAVKDLKQLEKPLILFYFDFAKKEINWYSLKENKWNWNDLTQSYCATDDLPVAKLGNKNLSENDAKQAIVSMSAIAFDSDTIYLIGGHHPIHNCIEYKLSQNIFTGRQSMRFVRNQPSVCMLGKYIYAVSGDKFTAYSTAVERYDPKSDSWKIMKDLPQPHYQGTCEVTYFKIINNKEDPSAGIKKEENEKDQQIMSNRNNEQFAASTLDKERKRRSHQGIEADPASSLKIMMVVLGGFSNKDPKKLAHAISIYDFYEQTWQLLDMRNMNMPRIPTFVWTPFVQSYEDEIVVLGSNETQQVFKVDLVKKQMKPEGGRLVFKDTYSMLYGSQQAISSNEIACILCRNKEKLGKIQRGYITIEDWSIL